MLTLPIKRQWFDLIANGVKKEEYRDITPYYITRFENIGLIKNFEPTGINKRIRLRNGYSDRSPEMEVLVKLTIGEGKTEWGAIPNKTYYVLHIESIEWITLDGVSIWRNIRSIGV